MCTYLILCNSKGRKRNPNDAKTEPQMDFMLILVSFFCFFFTSMARSVQAINQAKLFHADGHLIYGYWDILTNHIDSVVHSVQESAKLDS